MDHNQYCKEKLFSEFPEIIYLPSYKKALELGDDESAGIIFDRIFVPYILNLINKNPKDKNVKRAFKMIEEMLQHKNFDVMCVAKVEFIEPFLNKIQPTKDIEKYLLPKSLEAARDLARKWFKIDPNTWEAIE
jgi:hypothetical protein